MSWAESFPVMDAAMVGEFQESATPEERLQIGKFHQPLEVFNRKSGQQRLVTSLSWPHADASETLPVPDLAVLTGAAPVPADEDPSIYERAVRMLVQNAPLLMETFPDLVIRVYLANELSMLVDLLVDLGCEVFLLDELSSRHHLVPACSLIALEEENCEVTLIDAHRLDKAKVHVERTRAMVQSGLGVWRMPELADLDMSGRVSYRPLKSCHIGSNKSWPVADLLSAFIWHSQRGAIATEADIPGCGIRSINRGRWCESGFEEWFLTVAMYPRMAFDGMLTFVPAQGRSAMLTLDIEYATWANPNSELIYFPTESCCTPPAYIKL